MRKAPQRSDSITHSERDNEPALRESKRLKAIQQQSGKELVDMIEHNETYASYAAWCDASRKAYEMKRLELEINMNQADHIHAQRLAQQEHREAARRHNEACKPTTSEPPEIESLLSDLLLIVVAHARFNRDLGEAVSRLRGLGSSGQREESAAFLGSMKVAMRRVQFYQAIAGDLLASLEEAV